MLSRHLAATAPPPHAAGLELVARAVWAALSRVVSQDANIYTVGHAMDGLARLAAGLPGRGTAGALEPALSSCRVRCPETLYRTKMLSQ